MILLREAGVRLATGTDAGCWKFIPAAIHDEMAAFMEAGFTVLDVIAAATSVGAGALGIEDEAGSVQAGKCADLIVVSGNPCAT